MFPFGIRGSQVLFFPWRRCLCYVGFSAPLRAARFLLSFYVTARSVHGHYNPHVPWKELQCCKSHLSTQSAPEAGQLQTASASCTCALQIKERRGGDGSVPGFVQCTAAARLCLVGARRGPLARECCVKEAAEFSWGQGLRSFCSLAQIGSSGSFNDISYVP